MSLRSSARGGPLLLGDRSWLLRLSTRAPVVGLGHVGDRVRGGVLSRQRRPQVQKCFGFIAPLTTTKGVWWKALQVEQRDVRRESRLQGQDPLQLEALLVELRGLVSCRSRGPRSSMPFSVRQDRPGLPCSAPQHLLDARASQDFGRAGGDAIDPAIELLHGEAVAGRRLAHLNVQARCRA